MPKKVVFISNTANFSKFNRPFMRWFKQQGWQVDYVSAGEELVFDCDNQYAICMTRSPFNFKNIKAYKELKKILLSDYDIIHCHTPVGGVLARLAARKVRAKVIYTAHGFHFYKGASLLNWGVYCPIEKFLAKYTDCLITINQEDFCFARKKFNVIPVFKIDGVGVNFCKFHPVSLTEKKQLRYQLGYQNDDFIITNVAEINKNKNQAALIKNLPILRKVIPNVKVLLIGKDNYQRVRNLVVHYHLDDIVDFLGYRNDVNKLTMVSDLVFSASIREGLPVNIIEAMVCGVPVVCSKNRGHNSLIADKISGLLFSTNDSNEMVRCILSIYESPLFAQKMAAAALENSSRFSVDVAITKMAEIYMRFMSP
jgi:glycosyltransferase EpsD